MCETQGSIPSTTKNEEKEEEVAQVQFYFRVLRHCGTYSLLEKQKVQKLPPKSEAVICTRSKFEIQIKRTKTKKKKKKCLSKDDPKPQGLWG